MPQWSDRKVVHAYILAAIGLAYGRFEQELGYPAGELARSDFQISGGKGFFAEEIHFGLRRVSMLF